MTSITGGRTWLLALVILPCVAGFLLVGGQAGLALGCATAAALVVVAARSKPDVPIEVVEPAPGVPGGLLVLAISPLDHPRTAGIIASIADPSRVEAGSGVLVLAPAKSTRLARWADDLEAARFESQRVLTVSLASLATAELQAEGRVGDGDPLQAAEDALRTYAASEVVVVAAEGEAEREIAELERRLEIPLRRIVADAG